MVETDDRPGLSAMCLTYGRVHILEEAIQSFLLQDYSGPKELIILNDLAEQTLCFEHPEVQIINVSKRFASVGKKRDVCARIATYDWLLPWDDDDIYLPHRMRYSMQQIREHNLAFFKSDHALTGEASAFRIMRSYNFHSASCFSRELFNEVGGYVDMGSGQDQVFEAACRNLGHATVFKIPRPDLYYFYRWTDPPYHLSAYHLYETEEVKQQIHVAVSEGHDIPLSVQEKMRFNPETEVRNNVMHRIQAEQEPHGIIHLAPHWRSDYATLGKAFLNSKEALT